MSTSKYFLYLLLVCLVMYAMNLLFPAISVYQVSNKLKHRVFIESIRENGSDSSRPNNGTGLNTAEINSVAIADDNLKHVFIPSFSDYTEKLSFVSPYHRYWRTNCSAVFENQHSVIDEIKLEMDKARYAGNIPITTDKEITNFTNECSTFKKMGKYPDKPLSKEERDFPLAYIILTHKDAAQVERLLRAIYQPQNIYCIHPDKKSPKDYQRAIEGLVACFDNVFIVSKVESIYYEEVSRLKADINCMADLLQQPVQWKYVLNLCGQDFPLKTNLEIVQQLKMYRGLNAISGVVPHLRHVLYRTRYHWQLNAHGSLERTSKLKTPPPHNFTLYYGNAYIAATRAFTTYIIHDKRAIDLLEWLEDTKDSEEHYYASLQRYPGVPGGVTESYEEVYVRFIKWSNIAEYPNCIGKYVRLVCVFSTGYLNYFLSQPHLFANKFYYEYDPVTLQCLEEMLEYRKRYPETIHRYVPEFPLTSLSWHNLRRSFFWRVLRKIL